MPYGSEYIPVLISALSFLTLFLVLLAIANYFSKRTERSELREKIRKGSKEAGELKAPNATATSSKPGDKVQNRISNFLGTFGKRVAPKKSKDHRQMRPRYLGHQMSHGDFSSSVLYLVAVRCFWASE
jgi:hypothetical protein